MLFIPNSISFSNKPSVPFLAVAIFRHRILGDAIEMVEEFGADELPFRYYSDFDPKLVLRQTYRQILQR